VEAEDVHPVDAFATCSPEEQLTLQRCVGAIEKELGSVSQWQVDVFKLRHEQNLPIREIAERTQRSGDAVRSSLYRVKRLLVEAVEAQRGGSPSRPQGWSAA
jgi:DNA-directed RNA polymerase specialized sigma24 family protein